MKIFTGKNLLAANALALTLLAGSIALAQRPKENVDPARHPNLAAAQRLILDAWEKLGAAQQANEFDMNGHAAKAKALCDQASHEIKLAAETANRK
jgi:hypothetical protein